MLSTDVLTIYLWHAQGARRNINPRRAHAHPQPTSSDELLPPVPAEAANPIQVIKCNDAEKPHVKCRAPTPPRSLKPDKPARMRNRSLPPRNFERIVPPISLASIPIAKEPTLAPGPRKDVPLLAWGADEGVDDDADMAEHAVAAGRTAGANVSVDAAHGAFGTGTSNNHSCGHTRRSDSNRGLRPRGDACHGGGRAIGHGRLGV